MSQIHPSPSRSVPLSFTRCETADASAMRISTRQKFESRCRPRKPDHAETQRCRCVPRTESLPAYLTARRLADVRSRCVSLCVFSRADFVPVRPCCAIPLPYRACSIMSETMSMHILSSSSRAALKLASDLELQLTRSKFSEVWTFLRARHAADLERARDRVDAVAMHIARPAQLQASSTSRFVEIQRHLMCLLRGRTRFPNVLAAEDPEQDHAS
jgi:hypothetical protein